MHVFITGANRGIGYALTQHYLEAGHKVSATYRDSSSSKALIELADKYSNLQLISFEITDYSRLDSLSKELGNLDLLINNAGYYGPKGYGLGNTDVEEWRKVFEVNTIAPLKLIEALTDNMANSPIKTIACLSSKVGSMTENTSGGGYIYRSSKAALNSVVKSLHNDLSLQGYKVLALHPGWVQTQMGGPNALIDTNTSAKGLMHVIETSNMQHSGQFFDYQFNAIEW
ncbi:SDR family oxidoreductase [Vibrio sp. SCSIO 43136]|uniref:SDR family oxidoreductase n=1 Tax=Vibrio sp. SCSIO 43136 TaxID=2819101 RepID=UPI002075ED3D|nr:SDR family oxidoreductase [Vibrio sp. SCSIO 43136]USD66065.1 SDR family oxidoreductase [Vibrio sp. SCSIO 43136]